MRNEVSVSPSVMTKPRFHPQLSDHANIYNDYRIVTETTAHLEVIQIRLPMRRQ